MFKKKIIKKIAKSMYPARGKKRALKKIVNSVKKGIKIKISGKNFVKKRHKNKSPARFVRTL